jgi:hypothetical protein
MGIFCKLHKKAGGKGCFSSSATRNHCIKNKPASGVVNNLLHGILGLADRLLGFALTLLDHAFDFQFWIADKAPDAALDLASGLIGHTLDLVRCASHDKLLCNRSRFVHRKNTTLESSVGSRFQFAIRTFGMM